ncbi:MAG: hypothetical protein J4G17_01025 [Anaerolineae bacterium]|nr:hypothetical protein [Anaerolineae bacterium]
MVAKPRSPSYPSVDLETALDLLRKLYDKVHRGQFMAIDAASAWGYKSVSGPSKSKISTLRQYGLLEGKKGGKNTEKPKISRRGLTFVMRHPASREYQAALKTAALSPPLFREIFDALPEVTDGVLREYLLFDKNFTESGAERFIDVYRATIQLVNLDDDGEMSKPVSDNSNHNVEIGVTESSPELGVSGGQPPLVRITLSTQGEYAMLLPQMTSDEWDRKAALFDAHKDIFVQKTIEPQTPPEQNTS